MTTMTAPPAKTAISDTYPNPTNAVARTGFGALWDYVTGLLGSTGFTAGMLSSSRILDPDAIYNISLVPSVAGNALTMTVKSSDGATALAAGEPATVAQRNATLATGTVLLRNITANISTVISSGSTAGHSSGVLSAIYWYLIDNAGTQELAWSSTNYGVKGIVSTTAEGGAGAADSATTIYSTTARSNVAFRRIGRTFDSQATAGTWTAVPTTVELEPLELGASIVQNSQSAAYTTVALDAGKHILHPTADNNPRTFTIDSNANVPYEIGTTISFVNQINTLTIAITSDTMTLAGAGTTGSRTLAANGIATALKIAATSWIISGTGLT